MLITIDQWIPPLSLTLFCATPNSYHTKNYENLETDDPEEASVGFCRMIIYECTQMLSLRDEALTKKRKRLPVNLNAKNIYWIQY